MAEPWAPLCMEPDDWSDWQRMNPRLSGDEHADRPCRDCPMSFFHEMRAIDRCNGWPGMATEVSPERVDQVIAGARERAVQEQVAKYQAATGSKPAGNIREVKDRTVIAPCETCSHAQVCRIKDSIDLEGSRFWMPLMDPALTVAVTVTIECDFYAALPRPKGAKRELSPTALEAARKTAAAMRARLAEKRTREAAEAPA